jgi:hypothetical protein
VKKLKKLIYSISDQPYQIIQKLTGSFQFSQYAFEFIKIQGSPGANPGSIATVKASIEASEFPNQFLVSSQSRLAVADFIIRRFKQGIDQFAKQKRG